MKPENFGKNLSQIMEMLEMSQIDLANLTEITPAGISQICSGSRLPQLDTVCKIISVLNVKFERLVK